MYILLCDRQGFLENEKFIAPMPTFVCVCLAIVRSLLKFYLFQLFLSQQIDNGIIHIVMAEPTELLRRSPLKFKFWNRWVHNTAHRRQRSHCQRICDMLWGVRRGWGPHSNQFDIVEWRGYMANIEFHFHACLHCCDGDECHPHD